MNCEYEYMAHEYEYEFEYVGVKCKFQMERCRRVDEFEVNTKFGCLATELAKNICMYIGI